MKGDNPEDIEKDAINPSEEAAQEVIELLSELKARGYIITYGNFLFQPMITALYKGVKVQIMVNEETVGKIIRQALEINDAI